MEGPEERRFPSVVCEVDVGPGLDQCAGHFQAAKLGGKVEGGTSIRRSLANQRRVIRDELPASVGHSQVCAGEDVRFEAAREEKINDRLVGFGPARVAVLRGHVEETEAIVGGCLDQRRIFIQERCGAIDVAGFDRIEEVVWVVRACIHSS